MLSNKFSLSLVKTNVKDPLSTGLSKLLNPFSIKRGSNLLFLFCSSSGSGLLSPGSIKPDFVRLIAEQIKNWLRLSVINKKKSF